VVTHDQEEAMSMADRIAVLDGGRVQQVAGPVELYKHPANLFVAGFIGTSNLVAGRLEGGTFRSAVGVLPVSKADRDAQADASYLVVRPEDVRIGERGHGVLDGVVADVTFQGGGTHVAVTVAGLDTPFRVAMPGVPPLARGDAVSLTWDTAVVVAEAGR
jgi:ABC-type Fe3+/spermidine/putrescine transport system ATPase subunit